MRLKVASLKHYLQILLLFSLSAFYLLLFITNKNFIEIKTLSKDNLELTLNINSLEKELNLIKKELVFHENFRNFAFEKYAREEFKMSKKDEIVFFLPKK